MVDSMKPEKSLPCFLIFSHFSIDCTHCRRTKLFRWFSEKLCCQKSDLTENQFSNGKSNGGRGGHGGGGSSRNTQNYNSMRTLTTSLTVGSRRMTTLNPHHVVIVEQENVIHAKEDEVSFRTVDGHQLCLLARSSSVFDKRK